MHELGIEPSAIKPWFLSNCDSTYVLVRVESRHTAYWNSVLAAPLRRCYVDDRLLAERAPAGGTSIAEIVAAKLPDKGSTMAGDFGEILAYFYQAVRALPDTAIGPKKWRLKQDRRQPAPYSDVIHFVVPSWPDASADDQLLCSEVKTKSTSSSFDPISAALAGSDKDQLDRLDNTLLWLRERALTEDLGPVTLHHLNRFIERTDHPPVQTHFRAVAVVCTSVETKVLADAAEAPQRDAELVVITVPELKTQYESVFDAAARSLPPVGADS